MADRKDVLELDCPDCGGRVSARWDQVGEAVECPLCHQPFEVSIPPQRPGRVSGRPFHFQCLRCGSVLEARAHQSGHHGKCPTCGAVFTVPDMDPRTGLARTNADPGDDGQNPTPVHAYAAAGAMAPKIIRQADDSLRIECPRCGRQSPIKADNCPGCGLPFTMEGVSAAAVTAASSQGHASWAVGLVGLPLSFCGGIGILAGIFAIVSGLLIVSDRRNPSKIAGAAGLLLGILDCLISIGIWLSW